MKYFYGTYVRDKRLRALFDLVRLILEPDFARKTHITLRGPYDKKPSNKRWIGKEIGYVYLTKPDHFFLDGQNTVFLRAESIELNEFWWKPAFPGGVPHLTFYDGEDRRLAWQVFHTLKKFPWRLHILFAPITIIEKKHNYEENFFLKIDDLDLAFDAISEKKMTIPYIKNMHMGQRIFLLEKICWEIHGFTHPSSTH